MSPLAVLSDAHKCRLIGISDFTRRVLLATMEIPYGSVATYGEIAQRIGAPGASRAVGRALNRNPFIISVPCHRVVPADFPGRIGGFRYGTSIKEALLLKEKAL